MGEMAILGMFIVAATISELSAISTATIPEFLINRPQNNFKYMREHNLHNYMFFLSSTVSLDNKTIRPI